jgi:hypothetical protein
MAVTPERLSAVLSAVSTGLPLVRACAQYGVTRDQFYPRLNVDGDLAKRYAEAVAAQTRARFAPPATAIDCNEEN